MNRLQTVPGMGWISKEAAAVAYGLSASELRKLTANLKRSGASCPRKGLAIDALDRAVLQLRAEG